MTCFIAICSLEYINYYKILYTSLQNHAPGFKQILYHIGDIQESFDEKIDITNWYTDAKYPDTLTKICSLRARVVLDAFDKGYDKVVFLGAKVEFYDRPTDLLMKLDEYNAVVTPHITEPLPEDGRFPSNASVSFTGHISTDLVAFRNTPEIVKFLEWQDEIMKTKCNTTTNTYLDQSWLNFLPFFVKNVYILHDAGYNVAYWCAEQRNLHWINEKPFVLKKDSLIPTPLICFQFSGIVVTEPEKISKHQNRWLATGDYLKFLEKYCEKIM